MPVNSKDYAIVIGIDHYPDFRPLSGPINDAKSFHSWLTDADDGGGVPAANVELILSKAVNPPDSPTPYQDIIDRAISRIKRAATESGGRRFYFYFAGHGTGVSPDEAALCLSGWSFEFNTLALLSREYKNSIINRGLFDEVVFFLDCCRVRIANSGGFPPSNPPIRPAARPAKHYVAFAAEHQNEAFEAAAAAGGDQEDAAHPVRGNFTRALMAALWGAAANESGGVEAYSLKKYVEEETKGIAARNNQRQKAVILTDFSMANDEQVVFGTAQPQMDVLINFSDKRNGLITLKNSKLEVVKQGDVSTGPWSLNLKNGVHIIKEEATGFEESILFYPQKDVVNVNF